MANYFATSSEDIRVSLPAGFPIYGPHLFYQSRLDADTLAGSTKVFPGFTSVLPSSAHPGCYMIKLSGHFPSSAKVTSASGDSFGSIISTPRDGIARYLAEPAEFYGTVYFYQSSAEPKSYPIWFASTTTAVLRLPISDALYHPRVYTRLNPDTQRLIYGLQALIYLPLDITDFASIPTGVNSSVNIRAIPFPADWGHPRAVPYRVDGYRSLGSADLVEQSVKLTSPLIPSLVTSHAAMVAFNYSAVPVPDFSFYPQRGPYLVKATGIPIAAPLIAAYSDQSLTQALEAGGSVSYLW